ncbi:LysR family transcriptional regulator [Amylibacter sp. SFDW26]|uniref:LysR family transcriptional regulator n=1 Tax=Amylibacter sp. SFDW26 TaxID=2652722 RepID=UPI0012618BF7|nr:LysR family transcriptional regulator [Amylibacter sp. SFDW26]KAB7615952.1 LysR family transcriptional regulator [Amylibacter sp. SFDW26]
MEIKLIETFLDVLESRNFNLSAERLNITQSSVSARIKALETAIDATLFERGRAGATPTVAGFRFEPHARLLLATWDQGRRDAGAGPNRDGLLRLAGQFSLMRSVLVDWVIELRRHYPRKAIDLQADYSNQIVRDLSLGVVDIGILYSPQYLPDIDIQQVGSEQFVMVSTESNTINKISKETYINTGYTSFFNQCHQSLLPEFSNGALSVGFEELSVELLKRIGGSTYLPKRFIPDLMLTLPSIRFVEDAPEILHPVFSAVHIRKRHYAEVAHALKVLRNTL